MDKNKYNTIDDNESYSDQHQCHNQCHNQYKPQKKKTFKYIKIHRSLNEIEQNYINRNILNTISNTHNTHNNNKHKFQNSIKPKTSLRYNITNTFLNSSYICKDKDKDKEKAYSITDNNTYNNYNNYNTININGNINKKKEYINSISFKNNKSISKNNIRCTSQSSQSKDQRTIQGYIINGSLGKGTFGEVKMAKHQLTREKVAIKVLEKSKIKSNDDLERINREMKILKLFNHENIIKIYDIFEDNSNYYIVMEFISGGELFNYIVDKGRLDEKTSMFFFYQLVNGIEEIHRNNIAHRDLKPENLMFNENKILKIIDFGLSNICSDNQTLSTPCGSPCYASPEMILNDYYDGKIIDIWSLGVILYAMICGYLPFEESNNDLLFKSICKCDLKFPEYVSLRGKELIIQLLNPNPELRIKIKEIKTKDFYQLGKIEYERRNNIINQSYNQSFLEIKKELLIKYGSEFKNHVKLPKEVSLEVVKIIKECDETKIINERNYYIEKYCLFVIKNNILEYKRSLSKEKLNLLLNKELNINSVSYRLINSSILKNKFLFDSITKTSIKEYVSNQINEVLIRVNMTNQFNSLVFQKNKTFLEEYENLIGRRSNLNSKEKEKEKNKEKEDKTINISKDMRDIILNRHKKSLITEDKSNNKEENKILNNKGFNNKSNSKSNSKLNLNINSNSNNNNNKINSKKTSKHKTLTNENINININLNNPIFNNFDINLNNINRIKSSQVKKTNIPQKISFSNVSTISNIKYSINKHSQEKKNLNTKTNQTIDYILSIKSKDNLDNILNKQQKLLSDSYDNLENETNKKSFDIKRVFNPKNINMNMNMTLNDKNTNKINKKVKSNTNSQEKNNLIIMKDKMKDESKNLNSSKSKLCSTIGNKSQILATMSNTEIYNLKSSKIININNRKSDHYKHQSLNKEKEVFQFLKFSNNSNNNKKNSNVKDNKTLINPNSIIIDIQNLNDDFNSSKFKKEIKKSTDFSDNKNKINKEKEYYSLNDIHIHKNSTSKDYNNNSKTKQNSIIKTNDTQSSIKYYMTNENQNKNPNINSISKIIQLLGNKKNQHSISKNK